MTKVKIMMAIRNQIQPPRLTKPVRITKQLWPKGTVPVVSVFNWAYNHVKFIRESIESILMQETTFPVEIIIHDDASTDGTTEIIQEYKAKYPQLFRNIVQKKNQWSQGKSVMKPLLSAPRGEFVALTHGDDFWTDKNKIEKQYKNIKKNQNTVFCFHAVKIIDQTKIKNPYTPFAENKKKYLDIKDVFLNHYIPTCSLFYKKASIKEEHKKLFKNPFLGDRFLEWILSAQGIGYYDKTEMGVYRHHDNGITKQKNQDKIKLLEKELKIVKELDFIKPKLKSQKCSTLCFQIACIFYEKKKLKPAFIFCKKSIEYSFLTFTYKVLILLKYKLKNKSTKK